MKKIKIRHVKFSPEEMAYEPPTEIDFSKMVIYKSQKSESKGGIVSSETKKQTSISYVAVDDTTLTVSLADGRRLSLPLDWYPRLQNGSPRERNNWRLIGKGEGVHWPD